MSDAVTNRVAQHLETLRASPQRRGLIMLLGIAVGVLLAFVHWIGFAIAGIAIGIAAATLKEALLVALGTGVAIVVGFIGYLIWLGHGDVVTAMGVIAIAVVAIPLVLVVGGALVRGLG